MPTNSRLEILGLYPYPDLHRRPADEIHAALHDYEVAEVDWLAEIHAVNRDRDTTGARVPNRGDRRGRVHHREDNAAEHVIEIIRVLRHHELRRLVLGLPHGAGY